MNPNQRPHSRQPSQNNQGQFADLLGDFSFPKSNATSPNNKTLSQLSQPAAPKVNNYTVTKPSQPNNPGVSSINSSQFAPSTNPTNYNLSVGSSPITPPRTTQIPSQNLQSLNTQMTNLQSPIKPVPSSQVNLTNMQNQMLLNMENSLSKSSTIQKPGQTAVNRSATPDLNSLMKSQINNTTINQTPLNQLNRASNPTPITLPMSNSIPSAVAISNLKQTSNFGKTVLDTGLVPQAKSAHTSNGNTGEWQGFDIFNDNFGSQNTKNDQTQPSKQVDVFDLEFLGNNAAPQKSTSTVDHETRENPLGVLGLPVDKSPSKQIAEPTLNSIANSEKNNEVDLVQQLVNMGFSEKDSKIALNETRNNMERAIELLCNPPPVRKNSYEYPSEDVSRLQAMGFKLEQSKNALTEANGDVEKAIDILVHQKFTRKVSFSAEVPTKSENIVDTAKIVDTASLIGKSMFNSAKSVLAFSKKKVEAVLDNIAKERDEKNPPDRAEDELEWARSKYRDQIVSKSPEQSEPIQKPAKQSPVRMPGFEDEDEVDIPLEKKRTSSTQRSPSNTLLESNSYSTAKVEPVKPSSPIKNQNLNTIKEDVAATQNQIDSSNSQKSLGNELFKKGQFGDAELKYTEAIKALPEGHSLTFVLFNNRAAARLKTGDYRGAISDCDLVYNRDTQDVKCLLRRANAWEALEQWEKAKDDYKKILAIDPNTKGVSLAIARCTSALAPKEEIVTTTKESKPIAKPAVMTAAVKTAVDQAVQNLRAANEATEQEESQKFALLDTVNEKVEAWKKNKEKNLRALLSSLEAILWPGCNWKPINLGELITPQQVKVKYMKAVAKVHPDKLSANCTVEEKLIANSVFSILNKAWDEFKIANNM
ncbi:hypothetical protein HDV06_005647 [Boothiomyces sp. JEL0866]|nr:hypothetical protein HDV06_005647 [Boothiomyces sp. JEL0866]